MSHYTVLVIGDDVDGQLEPYDENRAVAPYKSYEVSPWFAKAAEQEGVDPSDLQALAAWANAKWADDHDQYAVDGHGLYSWSTYNPDSKWDWYQIGGRWAGTLVLKPGAEGEPPDLSGWTWREATLEERAQRTEGRTDQARKGDLDLQGMRDRAQLAAEAEWDAWHAVVEGTPEAAPWRHFVEQVEEGLMTLEEARSCYHSQPRIARLLEQERGLGGLDGGSEPEEMQQSREAYALQARLGAVPGYAVLCEGRWYAPGRMGWFGASSDQLDDRIGFYEVVNALIDGADDDTLITLVDAHI